MQRRLLAPLLVVAFLSAAAVASVLTTPTTDLARSPTDVDHVTLYQNGLAAITLVRPFQSTGGDHALTLTLPTTTVFDSLLVSGDGVTVKQLRSSLSADPALHAGDALAVHMADGKTHRGTFQSQGEGHLLLAQEGGTLLVLLEQVTAIEVTGRQVDPAGPGTTTVTVLVSAPPGAHTVRVSYLAHGSGWQPNYVLDPGTGAMTFFATLTGLQDWRNVTLDLVAGNPNTVYEVRDEAMSLRSLAFQAPGGAGAESASYDAGFGGSESLGSMHRYRYPGTVDLQRGETVRLPVLSGRAEIVRHSFQATGATHATSWQGLPEVYQVRNTLGEALPAGTVRLYLDGEWIGADTLPALGKLEEGNVTASRSDEVEARTVLQSQTRSEPTFPDGSRRAVVRVTSVYDLEVRNLSDAPVDVRAAFQAYEGGGTRVVSASPQPDRLEGQVRVWDSIAPAGATLHHRVTVETFEETYL